MRPRGKYVQIERRRLALTLIAAGRLTYPEIAAECDLSLRQIKEWAKKQREGCCSEGMTRVEAAHPRHLCLVDECYDAATVGHFCERHAPRPRGTPEQLARMMAGR